MIVEMTDDQAEAIAKAWLQRIVDLDGDEEWLEIVEAARTLLRLNWYDS